MKSKALMVIACVVLAMFLPGLPGVLSGQDDEGGGRGGGRGGQNQAPPPAPETEAASIPGVVAAGTKVQLIKEGFRDAQGATAAPDGSLLFTERSTNRILKVDKDGNISTYMENTRGVHNFSFDSKGRAIGLRWDPAQVAVIAPTQTVLSNKFENAGFGRPKDLVIDKKGGVYFTDQLGIFADGIGPGVYYVKPDGRTIKIATDISRPSGVMLSPDEKTLYVTDSVGTFIKMFDVQPDGNARNGRNFAEAYERQPTHSLADGLAVDAAGRLYAATYLGVLVFSPKGEQLGRIRIPRQPVNVAFAGPDKKTLYVLGAILGLRDADSQPEFGAVYKIPMLAEGFKGRAK
jgi:sugar lactone lactonase YvrE